MEGSFSTGSVQRSTLASRKLIHSVLQVYMKHNNNLLAFIVFSFIKISTFETCDLVSSTLKTEPHSDGHFIWKSCFGNRSPQNV